MGESSGFTGSAQGDRGTAWFEQFRWTAVCRSVEGHSVPKQRGSARSMEYRWFRCYWSETRWNLGESVEATAQLVPRIRQSAEHRTEVTGMKQV
jgi:hypothetical protein